MPFYSFWLIWLVECPCKVNSLGKAETLNAQFQQVFTQEDVSSIPNIASCGTVGMDPIILC